MEKTDESRAAAAQSAKRTSEKATAPGKPLAGLAEDRSAEAARRNTENQPEEVGGPDGPEPTRYGDWEVGGRCSDF